MLILQKTLRKLLISALKVSVSSVSNTCSMVKTVKLHSLNYVT